MTARKFAVRSIRSLLSPILLVVGTLLIGSACTGGETSLRTQELASLRQERLALIERFAAIQSPIRGTQAAALDYPGVRIAQDSFYASLRRFVVSEDPEVEQLLQRATMVGADLEQMSSSAPIMIGEPVTVEQQQAVADELRNVERELRPHIERALQDSTVHAAFAVAQDSLVEQMTRLDPNVPDTIRRMEVVAKQIQEVDIRIAELERDSRQ